MRGRDAAPGHKQVVDPPCDEAAVWDVEVPVLHGRGVLEVFGKRRDVDGMGAAPDRIGEIGSGEDVLDGQHVRLLSERDGHLRGVRAGAYGALGRSRSQAKVGVRRRGCGRREGGSG